MASRILLICSLAPAQPVFPGDDLAPRSALPGPLPRPGLARVSPLRRAAQTAKAMGLDAEPDPALAELDYGAWTGQRPEQVLARDPQGFALWQDDPHAAPHGGESFAAVVERMACWLHVRAQAGESLLAVTHPGPIQAALVHVLDAPLRAARAIGVRPLSRMQLSHDGRRWSLLLLP